VESAQISGKVFRFLSTMHPSLSKPERKRYAEFDPDKWYPWTPDIAGEFTDLMRRSPRDTSFARGLAYAATKGLPEDTKLTPTDVVAGLQTLPSAFVGPSGSGKSTIIRLLLGFEQASAGVIAFDDQGSDDLDITAVRRQFGVVLQTARINTASIFDNIGGGAKITLDEAWEAAEDAGFAADVREMPMEMHTVISEGGTNLSGGQRQRLLIARALVHNPRILIFDEATSALDNKTQATVSEALDRRKVTRVVIAHRLSTIRNADRIFVLAAGQIVETGKFDELVAHGGIFASMMARQLV